MGRDMPRRGGLERQEAGRCKSRGQRCGAVAWGIERWIMSAWARARARAPWAGSVGDSPSRYFASVVPPPPPQASNIADSHGEPIKKGPKESRIGTKTGAKERREAQMISARHIILKLMHQM